MDPNFIKLFRLSQLIIEYLLVRTVPFLPVHHHPPSSSLSGVTVRLSLSLCEAGGVEERELEEEEGH